MGELRITPLTGIGVIQPGDNLPVLLLNALDANRLTVQPGDVLVLAQKVVSKSENRYRSLTQVTPSVRARELAEVTDKDPRLVELILEESTDVVRAVPGVLITRHRNGLVMANAGIDASNLPDTESDETVLLLPEDSDASADRLRAALDDALGVTVAVVIADSFGRPWRNGVTNVAIGAAGFPCLVDRRLERDLAGRELKVTQVAVGDLVASAAGLVMGEGAEGIPFVHVRGLPAVYSGAKRAGLPARSLIRPLEQDLFR